MVRVLVVDDSAVFRSQIKAALTGAALVEVVGTAPNGKLALDRMTQSSVDLVTLDLEMPEMNGLETLIEMRRRGMKTRVVVFASKTTSGADTALEALRNGADDVVAKPVLASGDTESPVDRIRNELLPKILQFAHQQSTVSGGVGVRPIVPLAGPVPGQARWPKVDLVTFKPTVLVIGCSTGGPDALEKIFKDIGTHSRCPILIVQHMPPVFTKSLANRIETICGIKAAEATQWEAMVANRIYVAPGDYHMTLHREEGTFRLRLDQSAPRNCVRPAVDNLFESVAKLFGRGCMGFILTGMGSDGQLGSEAIKSQGGGIMIQDEKSCIVFGMPGAVYNSGSFDATGNLSEIRSTLQRMMGEL